MTHRSASVDVELRTHAGARWALLTVDNARRLNTLNTPVLDAFAAAVEQLAVVAELRWVVITGRGERAFAGGADVDEMAGLDPASAEQFIRNIHAICQGLRRLPVPVIARIDGYCLGAGLEIAAACDLRAASERAVFGMPEVQLGLPSVIEAALLPRLIGWGRASDLLLTGRVIDAAEALDWGLIGRVVPPEDLDRAVLDWGQQVATAGPQAVRLQKELMASWAELPLDSAIEAGVAAFVEAYRSDEPRHMIGRFREHRRQRKTE